MCPWFFSGGVIRAAQMLLNDQRNISAWRRLTPSERSDYKYVCCLSTNRQQHQLINAPNSLPTDIPEPRLEPQLLNCTNISQIKDQWVRRTRPCSTKQFLCLWTLPLLQYGRMYTNNGGNVQQYFPWSCASWLGTHAENVRLALN